MLKELLDKEEENLLQELSTKQFIEGCEYCKEQKAKRLKYEQDLEIETMLQCKRALEREKIAKGMQSTKSDEFKLRAQQKMQMEEKENIEREKKSIEGIWHQVLLDDIKRKDDLATWHAIRLKDEMRDRRKCYDEQIKSAKRDRQETILREREEENKRLERLKQRMEQDYKNALKRKQEQHTINKINFIKGHEFKMYGLKQEKEQNRADDARTLDATAKELRREKKLQEEKIRTWKQEEKIFTDYHNKEKMIASAIEKEADKILEELGTKLDKEHGNRTTQQEVAKRSQKEDLRMQYQQYLENMKEQNTRERSDRKHQMERVKRIAYSELERSLYSAKQELIRQNDYRDNLTEQIRINQRALEEEMENIECKQRAFTRNAITFKEAMRDKIGTRNDGIGTNPVHPFYKDIKNKELYGLPLLPNS